MENQQITKDLILLQIAITKQLLEIKEMLKSLIKQEEPKEEPKYVKYL